MHVHKLINAEAITSNKIPYVSLSCADAHMPGAGKIGDAHMPGAGKIGNIFPISNICPIGNVFPIGNI
jgi:hypothetical protein